MDAELREFLENMSRTLHKDIEVFRSDVSAEFRDVREEMRSIRAEMREMSQRISCVGMDYYEARRVRDLRAIGLEARVEELERRMSEREGRDATH